MILAVGNSKLRQAPNPAARHRSAATGGMRTEHPRISPGRNLLCNRRFETLVEWVNSQEAKQSPKANRRRQSTVRS